MTHKKQELIILETVKEILPSVIGVYLFGSQTRGETHSKSDLDLGILNLAPISGDEGFTLKSRLANALGCDIDIVDMRTADTVTNAQILETERLIFVGDHALLDRFEGIAMAKYAQLNLERREILDDIERSGRVRV